MEKHTLFNVGFLGVGEFARIHLAVASHFPNVNWVGCYDVEREKAITFSKEFGLAVFDNPQSLIDQCDILLIAPPAPLHYEMIDASIRAGKHIIVSRPLVNNYVQADDVRSLVREGNVRCCAFTPYRVHPCLDIAKKYVGRPVHFESHARYTWREMGDKNLIYHGMLDQIDLVMSLVSSPVKTIKAKGFSLVESLSPDVVSADIGFFNGESASFVVSRTEEKKQHIFRMYEPKKYIEINFDEGSALRASFQTEWSFERAFCPVKQNTIAEQCVIESFISFLALLDGQTPRYKLANEQDEYKNLEVVSLIAEQVEKFMNYTQ